MRLSRAFWRSRHQPPADVWEETGRYRDVGPEMGRFTDRGGLVRVREFTMKDAYSLGADREGMERQYRAHHEAYLEIYRRCALPVETVRADVGMMGGSASTSTCT